MFYPKEFMIKNSIIENCTIEITNQCNFACLHCDYPKKRKGTFMSLQLLDIIAHQLLQMGTFRIVISGGEPFEHPDILKIVDKLIGMSFEVKIITNGYYITENQIKELCKYRKLEIVFSLLGTCATHDHITTVDGSFSAIDSKVKKLKNAACKVSFQTCVMHNNFDNLKELNKYVEQIGVPHKLDPFLTNTLKSKHIPAMRLTDAELKKYYMHFSDFSNIASRVFSEGKVVRLKSCDCGVAKSTITIEADGNVLPCGNIRKSVGDVVKTSIEDIWKFSPALKVLRNRSELDRPECAMCEMNTLCSRCIAMAISEHNDWKSPPKECCRHMRCLKEVAKC